KAGNAHAFGMVATKAAWTPSTRWNASVSRAGVRLFGVSQPPRLAKAPATTARATPISASRASVLAMLRGRRSVCTGGSRYVDMFHPSQVGLGPPMGRAHPERRVH